MGAEASTLIGPWPDGGALNYLEPVIEAEIRKFVRRRTFVWSEGFFLDVVAKPRNRMEIYWSVLALRQLGTAASVPALKGLLTHKMVDAKVVALTTIAHLVGKQETSLYVDCLNGGWYRQPWAALWCIQVTADPAALPAVLTWMRKYRSALRTGRMHFQHSLEVAFYLYRLQSFEPAAAAALSDIREDVARDFRNSGFRKWRGYEPVLRAIGIEAAPE